MTPARSHRQAILGLILGYEQSIPAADAVSRPMTTFFDGLLSVHYSQA